MSAVFTESSSVTPTAVTGGGDTQTGDQENGIAAYDLYIREKTYWKVNIRD